MTTHYDRDNWIKEIDEIILNFPQKIISSIIFEYLLLLCYFDKNVDIIHHKSVRCDKKYAKVIEQTPHLFLNRTNVILTRTIYPFQVLIPITFTRKLNKDERILLHVNVSQENKVFLYVQDKNRTKDVQIILNTPNKIEQCFLSLQNNLIVILCVWNDDKEYKITRYSCSSADMCFAVSLGGLRESIGLEVVTTEHPILKKFESKLP